MRRTIARELMDEPVDDAGELEANLRDIAFANAHLGGTTPVVRALRRLGERRVRGVRSVLDVGCGAADVSLAVVRDSVDRGVQLDVTCLDHSEQMLALARRAAGADPAFAFVRADGASLPFADGAFDVAICTLALHHFEPDGASALLRELRRVVAGQPGRVRPAPLVVRVRRNLAVVAHLAQPFDAPRRAAFGAPRVHAR